MSLSDKKVLLAAGAVVGAIAAFFAYQKAQNAIVEKNATAALSQGDKEQAAMMEERVLVTDEFDMVVGNGSKKDTHIWKNIQKGLLHRAFSVFLINEEGKLLIQQRSATKVTFPEVWANTCCSHPLDVESEKIEKDHLGVKNAARRKLEHELGIPPEQVPLDSFTFMTRIHYIADCPHLGSLFGEHELDHVMICKPKGPVTLHLNKNEVQAVDWVGREELLGYLDSKSKQGVKFSQWFRLIATQLLPSWWSALEQGGPEALKPLVEEGVIYRARGVTDTSFVKEVVPGLEKKAL